MEKAVFLLVLLVGSTFAAVTGDSIDWRGLAIEETGWLELFYSVVNGRVDEDMELEGIVRDSNDEGHIDVEVKDFKEELILVCQV